MQNIDDKHIKESFSVGQASVQGSNKSVLKIDFERYFECTRHFNVDEDDQRQIIKALHGIMLAFVDMGFELNPVQHTSADSIACGQAEPDASLSDQSLSDVVKSIVSKDESLNTVFAKSSEGEQRT